MPRKQKNWKVRLPEDGSRRLHNTEVKNTGQTNIADLIFRPWDNFMNDFMKRGRERQCINYILWTATYHCKDINIIKVCQEHSSFL